MTPGCTFGGLLISQRRFEWPNASMVTVAEWIAYRTLMQQVVGSNPAWAKHTNVQLVWNSSKNHHGNVMVMVNIKERMRNWLIDWLTDALIDWLIDWVGYEECSRYYDKKWYQCIHQTMVYYVNSVFWHFIWQYYLFWIDIISVFEIYAHNVSSILAWLCYCKVLP